MHQKEYTFALAILLSVNFVGSTSIEDQCIEYYQTGNEFNLNILAGKQWNLVYLWPRSQRPRSRCESIDFKNLSKKDIDSSFSCENLDLSNETVVRSTYKNSSGRLTSVSYYGDEEVKHLMRSCDRISKYIFLQINENYVMGINCSSGGRATLLSRILPTKSQVETVVNGIEIMSGRDGGPDCELRS